MNNNIEIIENKFSNSLRKKEVLDKIFNIVIFIIFFVITMYVALKHEPWNDEAQAWLITRDLTIPEIIAQMKYEGHSFLWYMILLPFVKLGFPYKYMSIISTIFVNIAALFLLYKIDTNKIFKLLILFSEPIIYYFGAISRCYSLIPILLFIVCYLYTKKEQKPYLYAVSLIFLANVHIAMLPFVSMLIITFFIPMIIKSIRAREKREIEKYVLSFVLSLTGILIFLIQVLDLKCKLINDRISIIKSISDIIGKISSSIYSIIREIAFYNVSTDILSIIIITLTLLLIFVSFYYKRQALIFWPSVIAMIVLNTLLNFVSNVQRSQLIILFLFFFVVCSKFDNTKKEIPKFINYILYTVYIILCIASTFDVVTIMRNEVTGTFSDSQNVAKFISNNLPKNSTIYTLSEIFGTPSIIANFDKSDYRFYNLTENRYYTYYTWNNHMDRIFNINKIEERFDNSLKTQEKTWVIAVCHSVYYIEHIKKLYDVDLVYTSRSTFNPKGNIGEEYYIYEVLGKR